MNGRIQELAERAETKEIGYYFFDREKFAELIVKECIHIALRDALPDWGSESSKTNTQCVKIAADLKQHFGVQE